MNMVKEWINELIIDLKYKSIKTLKKMTSLQITELSLFYEAMACVSPLPLIGDDQIPTLDK